MIWSDESMKTLVWVIGGFNDRFLHTDHSYVLYCRLSVPMISKKIYSAGLSRHENNLQGEPPGPWCADGVRGGLRADLWGALWRVEEETSKDARSGSDGDVYGVPR